MKTGRIKTFSEIAKDEVVMWLGKTAAMRGAFSPKTFIVRGRAIMPKLSKLSWPTDADQKEVNECIENAWRADLWTSHPQYKSDYVPHDDWQGTLWKARDHASNKIGATFIQQYKEEGVLDWNDKDSIVACVKRFENGDYPNGGRPLHEEYRNSLGEPDTREGNYYVTAMDGHGTYLLLGPFINRHADALDSVYWTRQVAEKDPKFQHWMKFGTARFESDYLIEGKANAAYLKTYPNKPQPSRVQYQQNPTESTARKRVQAKAKAAMVMIRALKA